jgi:DNA-binding MarR family transcriptional regulator
VPAAPSTSYLLELWLAAGRAGELIARELRPIGLPAHLFGVLTHVAAREPVAPSTIAAEEGIPVTTVRDHVQALVDHGLVERVPNPDDRRSYLLVRTRAGVDLLSLGNAVLAGIYTALEPRLPRPASEYEQRLRELGAALAEVRGARDRARRPAPATAS